MSRAIVIQIIIISITTVGLAATFYFLQSKQSKKTVSPISSKPLENKTVSNKQPSKTLKEYVDNSGFSFKYPEDVEIGKKDINDTKTYANLELTSPQEKGNISVKIEDTKLKSVDDWLENKLASSSAGANKIKIGEIDGSEIKDNDKLIAASIDQGILFTIEVTPQDQKYWLNVYNTLLSSFSFVSQQASGESDSSSSDVTLKEEIVE